MKSKVFGQQRDAGDIPWRFILWTAGRVLFQSKGPTTAEAWCWDKEIHNQGIRRSNRSAE